MWNDGANGGKHIRVRSAALTVMGTRWRVIGGGGLRVGDLRKRSAGERSGT
ncbi:hypothetical protein ACE1SV_06690 [Streptomyces sp. E-15]